MTVNFVSLFAGVGGFDLGFEQAGMTCVGQVEIDKQARAILEQHWPNVPKHNDVRTAKEWADDIKLRGNVQLVCGGFPCQDLSVAGRRAGLAGSRSGLFFDALDFAVYVGAEWLVLENVPGLLTSNNGQDFATVLAEMANAGYSYVEWRVFDSQFYGVPQRRRRVFIVGHTGNPSTFPIFVERESSDRDTSQSGEARQDSTAEVETSVIENGEPDLAFNKSGFAAYRNGVGTLTATYRAEDHLIVEPFTESSFANYAEGVGTLRATGGSVGYGSETLVVTDDE